MTVVIDVGAARYGDDYSMERLIEQFSPKYLYAIDPNPALAPPGNDQDGSGIELIRAAAWTYDGKVGYVEAGLRSSVSLEGQKVSCIDLARVVEEVAAQHEGQLVLKLDCEGSEYTLLAHLMSKEADKKLDLCIVEWHPIADAAYSREMLEDQINCPIEEWPY